MSLTERSGKPPYLPAVVMPTRGAITVLSDSSRHLRILADSLNALAPVEKALVLAAIFEVGLWRSWALGFVARRWQKKLKGTIYHAYSRMFATPRGLKATDALMKSVVKHLLSGRDREESFSIGGFSTRELQFIANVVAIVRNTAKEAAVEAACAAAEAGQTDATVSTQPYGWNQTAYKVAPPRDVTDLTAVERLGIANDAVSKHIDRKRPR